MKIKVLLITLILALYISGCSSEPNSANGGLTDSVIKGETIGSSTPESIEKRDNDVATLLQFPATAPKEYRFINTALHDCGYTWTDPWTGLQSTVTSIVVTKNIEDAGWSRRDFYQTDVTVSDYEIKALNECINDDGNLLGDLLLITANVTVKNTDSVKSTVGNNSYLFPHDIVKLVSADGGPLNGVSLFYSGSAAFSGCHPIEGETAYVEINPGESVSYSLGFILDKSLPEGIYFLADTPSLTPDTILFYVAIPEELR